MEILVDNVYGPCGGINDAFSCVFKFNEKIKIYGDLAHNKFLMKKLEYNKNINVVYSLDDIHDYDNVVIRSHGITLEDMDILKKKKCNIIDKTCCNVKKVQSIAESSQKNNKILILTGNRKHPEVKGISSRCRRTFIVDSLESTKNLIIDVDLNMENIVLASQTTFDIDEFNKISDFLKHKFKNLEIYDSICRDHIKRRKRILDVGNFIDYCIVVGDKSSSNSMNLYNVARKICDSEIVEGPDDFDIGSLKGKNRIYITCAASVLKESVENLIFKIKNLTNVKIKRII